jgi:translation initiation factor 3 subunit E
VYSYLIFILIHQIYSDHVILETKLEVVSRTKMVDVEKSIFEQLHPNEAVPASMTERRSDVLAQLKSLKELCRPLLDIIDDHELYAELRDRNEFTLEALRANHGIQQEHVDGLFHFARFKFDLGHYAEAGDFLFFYRQLARDEEKSFLAAWGKLAAEILRPETEDGAETCIADLFQLRELIDSRPFMSPVQQLQQRTWLLHWSLFVFFNHEQNRAHMVDFFTQERYLNALQTAAPHLLRYLIAAAILNRGSSSTVANRRRQVLPELAALVEQEMYTFRDPLTEFLRLLLVEFDFEAAQKMLKECERVCASDFFLSVVVADFMDGARTLFMETYFKIHKSIELGALSQKLELSEEEAEKWIVNLIRHSKLSAKIDSQSNQLHISNNFSSIYQQVIDKTKPLISRTQGLVAALERRERALGS